MFRHPLAREVAIIVAVKTLIVLLAGLLVFGPGQRIRVTEASTLGRFLDGWGSLPTSPGDNVIGGHP